MGIPVYDRLVDVERLLLLEERELRRHWSQRFGDLQFHRSIRNAVQRCIGKSHAYVPHDVSYVKEHPEDALELLQLPCPIEYALGRKGLGVRAVSQLAKYSRTMLREGLLNYATISHADPSSPCFSEEDLEEWLDSIELTLARHQISLPQ